MKIQHNISAINSSRIIMGTNRSLSKNLEKLSSGYKINRAGDDAAGLAISEGMRMQIAALDQARQNAQDGISLVQTVEGALSEVHSMLGRMKLMAVQAANGTYTDDQREMLNGEMQQLKEEIGRIGTSTSFSGVNLFTNGVQANRAGQTSVYRCTLDLASRSVKVDYTGLSSRSGAVSATGGYDALADKIATEYFPNAIDQIFNAFPSLKTAVGSDQIGMELRVEYIDGPSNTLAFAQFFISANGKAFNMNITVDATDFSDQSIQPGSPDTETLESTIAHELMHSVMQYTLPKGMSGYGAPEFPGWFKEGTAQLAGGGFPTNWNTRLEQIAGALNGSTDSSRDGDIANYLKAYDVADRPYGHGYLAAAYIGYLANGGGTVSASGIAAGMDKVFADLLNGDSFYDVVNKYTGGKIQDQASLERLFDNPGADLVGFVRQLSVASLNGAGSVIAPGGLSAGGDSIIGDTVTGNQAFYVAKTSIGQNGGIQLMIGLQNTMEVRMFRMDSMGLRLTDTHIKTLDDANKAVDSVEAAIDQVSVMRSHYGAAQNRLEHVVASLGNTTENLTAAESRIRDTDMAFAITEYTRERILLQSGQAMLAQANQTPGGVLSLLGSA